MVWIVTVREVIFTVAAITAIISHAMSSLTLTQSAALVYPGSKDFATLGVAAGELTILSLPLILTYDMAQEKSYSATVLAELVWLAGVGVFWIIVGVKTMGITGGAFKNCAAVDTTLTGLCTDAQTLMIFSIVTGALLLAYCAGLTGFAVSCASSGNPVWTDFNVGGKKKH